MTAPTVKNIKREALRIAGELVHRDRVIEVTYPYTGEVIATVPKATIEDVRRALRIARDFRSPLTRFDRYRILMTKDQVVQRVALVVRRDVAVVLDAG